MDSTISNRLPLPWGLLVIGPILACSGRGHPDPGFSPTQGVLVDKPGGGTFVADTHFGGQATRLRLLEIGWGRLVDVHDVDELGQTNPIPVLRDVVVSEGLFSDGATIQLETNPVTHDTRLVILRPRDAPDTGSGTFTSILGRVSSDLGPVLPKNDDGSAIPPLSYVARNAVMVLRFDDLLDSGQEASAVLPETVRLTTGYPPITPQTARIVFDPSHGGIANDEFHSTRVLVDFTVSEREAASSVTFLPLNAAGLPASSRFSSQASASLRVPSRLDPPNGRFFVLTNLAGRGVQPAGPTDPVSGDIVRAFRAGNADDDNAGFLLDLEAPRLVGSWEIVVDAAREDPLGPSGFGFEVDLTFQTPCRAAPRGGDTLQLGGELYEVREAGAAPDLTGRVAALRLLRLAPEPLQVLASLLGVARLLTPFRNEGGLDDACWLTFTPQPGAPPSDGIDSDSRVTLRFSEPMDPDSFRSFDTFRILRGRVTSNASVRAQDIVVGAVRAEQSLQEFTFIPRLPLANQGEGDYLVQLIDGSGGVKDLSGTNLAGTFDAVRIFLAKNQPPRSNAGLALRFESRDELDPPGFPDIRGQVTYDRLNEVLRPRETVFTTHSADRANPIPGQMATFPFGVQTPLSSLGSKLQMIWRYCDFGFRVRDETLYNLDVIGLSWSPRGGAVISDFFPLFELRLAHSRYLPDEYHPPRCAPVYPDSGIKGWPFAYTENLLEDPRGEQAIVHPRGLGYRIRPSDLTINENGTPLMPFPWNRAGAPFLSYIWRDTAILAKGGRSGGGIPLLMEVRPPVSVDTGAGSVASPGNVPSFGLPLLWEVRCFPSTGSLGLNSLDVLLPVPGWSTPNYRTFSTGGLDQSGRLVMVDPDLELLPSGGFNPTSNPPGQPTPLTTDNSFYVGSIDTVVRISRAVSIWIDTGDFSPLFVEPVIEPRSQLGSSALEIEYRGAISFSEDAGNGPFDAASLDPYGDFEGGTVEYSGDGSWSRTISDVDGARFIQVRFSFVNDIVNSLSPELDSFGIAYEK